MDSESLFLLFPITLIFILLIGFILWKTGNEGGERKERARSLIYGPITKPIHGMLANFFERPLSKREKIGWSIVILLLVLAFLADYFRKHV
jgi:hypothetical protein